MKKSYPPEYLQVIQRFRLLDDTFMTAVFDGDIEATQLVLRIILDKSDLIVETSQAQHLLKNLQGRSSQLDIHAYDSTGQQFVIEIQRSNSGAGSKRARYHSSLMDANSIKTGEHTDALPESYVIFITENDVMKGGLALYHVERMILETGEPFNDDSHIIYVNGAIEEDTAIGKLMHDFRCTDPDDMYYSLLAERTRHFKSTEEGRETMCRQIENLVLAERESLLKEFDAERKANSKALVDYLMKQNPNLSELDATKIAESILTKKNF